MVNGPIPRQSDRWINEKYCWMDQLSLKMHRHEQGKS